MYAGLAELVEDTLFAFSSKHLDVDRTAPVVKPLIFLAIVVGEQSNLAVVQILVIGLYGEDGNCHASGMENVRLSRTHRREPSITEHLGTNHLRAADIDGRGVFRAAACWLATIGGIADNSTFWSIFR